MTELLDDHGKRGYPHTDIAHLLKSSKAEHVQSIPEFVENGAAVPNGDLRKVAKCDDHRLQSSTVELLEDLRSQCDCDNQYAFRVQYVRPEAVTRLTTPGTHIADLGIQSASIHLPNAEDWQLERPVDASKKFIFVLGKDVPKKNIATGFLVDHVVVLPGQILEIGDSVERAGTTYVMLKAAHQQVDQPIYNPFDGMECSNFADKTAYLASCRSQ
ncbi:MAG: hypothetical protein GTN84_03655 [Hydrogenophaga sp.]|uniref:hypothetical protein n=1 Tax=Hydrogenophaga sp. TaxID=1904254 RepID=UPI0016B83490|nr:hypothetical protein [Hydrogenophaga sp.]NIM40309.1 hypothetical protein [Hydrogenophaga sp.]NIN25540.1 hypothetical protein [Hydrogenophaga sp.]NIN30192.1 hypothetical protein [Hydrogenophaga sp.]NIN54493.1 hypothetical protein [Hydrogenophaga sp.]NIO50366.1 hypothetical protein [Hydrogenophaga sp.]